MAWVEVAVLGLILASTLGAENLFNSASISALQMTEGSSPVLLAGTREGLFISRDEMKTWTPATLSADSSMAQPGISQIERDPSNASAFYAAESRDGHILFRNAVLDKGVRIYRTDNRGESWALKNAALPAEGQLQRLYVMRSQPGHLYVLLDVDDQHRVYRSTDRGDSWRYLRTVPPPADMVLIHPGNPDLWYYETGRAIYRSTDQGASWGSAGPFPIRATGNLIENTLADFAVDPNNTNILLMVTNGPTFGSDEYSNGFFFSGNQGASWERKTEGSAEQLFNDGITLAYQYANAFLWVSIDGGRTLRAPVEMTEHSGIAEGFLVDRRNPQIIYSGMLRSTDTGRTWQEREGTVTPFIGVAGGPIALTGSTNDRAPRTSQMNVKAIGSSAWTLDFTIETSAAWLRTTPSSGTTATGVRVEASAGGLAVGVHQARLTIRSEQSFNKTAEIPVTLTVSDDPAPPPSPTIMTFAGDGRFGSTGDGGPAVQASLEGPVAVAVDRSGAVLIVDKFAHKVRRVNPNGIITTFAGTGVAGYSGDGGPAVQAQLNYPAGLAVGPDGSVYIADGFNRRVRVVTPDGKIKTYFGNGEYGSFPNQGTIAQLYGGFNALTFGPDGAMYASGAGTIRLDPSGTYRLLSSRSYKDLAVAPDGAVYGTRLHQVFVLPPGGSERVIAGGSAAGYVGDGGPALDALFDGPAGLAIDADGRVFVADYNNDVVRVIETDQTIRTYAGTGVSGFSGDGGPAEAAELSAPDSVEVGPAGELYICASHRVRMVMPPTATPPPVFTSAGIVSAASFLGGNVAPNQIVSIFGQNFGSQVVVATATPLPETLGGVHVELIDSGNATHRLPLFFVAPGQINALIPAGAALGQARLRVVAPGEVASEAPISVEAIAPGLFSANATGSGVAAAAAIRVASDGTQTPIPVLQGSGPVQAAPIDMGPEGDQVVLLLFGTGFRGLSGLVAVTIGGISAAVLGIAPQPQFVGLDQLNVLLPRELSGSGEVEIRVTIDGKSANVTTVTIGGTGADAPEDGRPEQTRTADLYRVKVAL